MYTVNSVGKEYKDLALEEAIAKVQELKMQGDGADLWLDDQLVGSCFKNCFTGDWENNIPQYNLLVAILI